MRFIILLEVGKPGANIGWLGFTGLAKTMKTKFFIAKLNLEFHGVDIGNQDLEVYAIFNRSCDI